MVKESTQEVPRLNLPQFISYIPPTHLDCLPMPSKEPDDEEDADAIDQIKVSRVARHVNETTSTGEMTAESLDHNQFG